MEQSSSVVNLILNSIRGQISRAAPFVKLPAWIGLLAIGLLSAGCATLTPVKPVDLTQPGWSVWTGQAVWLPPDQPEAIAGDLLVASDQDGKRLIILTKPPITIFTAQTDQDTWQLNLTGQPRERRGRLPAPRQFAWFAIPDLLQDGLSPPGWAVDQPQPHIYILQHPGGERIQLVLDP